MLTVVFYKQEREPATFGPVKGKRKKEKGMLQVLLFSAQLKLWSL